MKAVLTIVALATVVAQSSADEGKSKLTDAIIAFGQRDLDGAKKLLDEAERSTGDTSLLAKIKRQRGIIFEAEGDRLAAVLEFMGGLYYDSQVDLSSREHGESVVRLFGCAKDLYDRGIKEAAVSARYPRAFEPEDWTCPQNELPSVQPRSPGDGTSSVVTTPEEVSEDGVFSKPWIWLVIGGVVAVAGSVALVAVLSGDDTYNGSTGVRVEIPGS